MSSANWSGVRRLGSYSGVVMLNQKLINSVIATGTCVTLPAAGVRRRWKVDVVGSYLHEHGDLRCKASAMTLANASRASSIEANWCASMAQAQQQQIQACQKARQQQPTQGEDAQSGQDIRPNQRADRGGK